MKHRSLVLLAFSFALAAPILAQVEPNIVQNGDFSQGLTDWNVNSSAALPWIAATPVSGDPGIYGAYYDQETYTFASTGCVGQNCITGSPSQLSSLDQQLSTTVGTTYTLTFDFASPGGNDMELEVLFGGVVVDDLFNLGQTGLTQYTITGLIATAPTTDIEFLGRQDPGYDILTNVTVADPPPPSATPEPGALVLVGTGLLSLAGAVRRRLPIPA
jgi:hypothetical protein